MGRLGTAARFQSEVTVPSCGVIFLLFVFFLCTAHPETGAKQSFPYIISHLRPRL